MLTYKVTVDNGVICWYMNDKLHCEHGPACIRADGGQQWWVNGKQHRTDGPAVVCPNGYRACFVNGVYHRTGGPAIIWADGRQEWYLNGAYYTDAEFNELMKPKTTCDGKVVEIDGVKYQLKLL